MDQTLLRTTPGLGPRLPRQAALPNLHLFRERGTIWKHISNPSLKNTLEAGAAAKGPGFKLVSGCG